MGSKEERIEFLERRIRQLWILCQKFRITMDTCESGCCNTDAEIGLPDFDEADTDHFYLGKCIYCDIRRKEHKQGFCNGKG